MAKTGMPRNSTGHKTKKPPPPPVYKPVGDVARQQWKTVNGNNGGPARTGDGTSEARRGRRTSRHGDNDNYNYQASVIRLWDDRDVPQHIRDELLPAFSAILQDSLDSQDAFDNFVSYNIYWHPTCSDSIRKRYAKHFCTQHARDALIPPLSLVKILYYLRGQTQIMQLLADRGPDFGLTLLMLLDIVYQVAFCMRRSGPGSRDSKRNMAMVVLHCPRVLEVLSLHLDCSPLAPHFLDKFLLTCEGFLFHRKVPNAALPRFYQLQYFLSPESRPFLFKQCYEWPDEHGTIGSAEHKSRCADDFLPPSLLKAVETRLWELARSISLGRPSPETRRALSSGPSRQIVVRSHLDAMAVVFERLNHVARAIFGTPICSYGSAATGFATQSSDVDVVLQLGTSGVNAMLTQARKLRDNGIGLDLNPFPSKTQGGFTQAVGDWSWLSKKDPTVAAAIWAGRLFGWAVHRLYGWHVQCVQSAYVPIVRVLGCVGADGVPHAVPDRLRPYSSVEASVTTAMQSIIKQNFETAVVDVDDPRSLFTLKTISPSQCQMLSKLCALSVVAECQYASWSPALADGMDTLKCAAYLAGRLEDPDKKVLENQLFDVAIGSIGGSGVGSSLLLGLDIPHVSEALSDGRINLKAAPPPSGEEIWLVEADFSADRQVGIHNSRLLRAYASCSPFVVALGLLVKHWAKNRGIGDAYAGYLSGYQWTLMVIHYLQHFFCVTPPQYIIDLPEYQQLQRHMKRAGLPAFNYLPLLPNLQHPMKDDPSKGLCIVEMEGPVEVSFFQPGMGCNRKLPRTVLESCREEGAAPLEASEPSSPRQREWPEDRLLLEDPLMYAYEQLTPPFDLEPVVASGMSEEGLNDLWLLRVRTAPRIEVNERRKKGKNEMETNYQLWDARRQQNKKQLLQEPPPPDPMRKRGSEAGHVKLLPFPPLSSIRSRAFIADHIMIKGQLSLPFGPDLTLTELLYGFFEYYGLRFNYATDIADIDRVPELPRGKKEFFETALFTPKIFEISPYPKDEELKIHYPIIVSDYETRDERHSRRRKRLDDIESAPEESATASRRTALSVEPEQSVHVPDSRSQHDLKESPRDVSPDLPLHTVGDVAPSDAEEEPIVHDEEDAAHVAHAKETVGRGNGPFQYHGRHFLCIRDPFEKLRTIGPPCRCQSHISTELILALQLFGTMRAELRKNGNNVSRLQSAVDSLFAPNASGIHPVGRLRHPIIESLGQALSRLQSLHPATNESHRVSAYAESMYPGLVSTVLENGKYRIAFATYKERMNENHSSKPPPPSLPPGLLHKPVAESPELDRVSQEPTRPSHMMPPRAYVTPEEKLTPPPPTPYKDDEEELDINCVPPGFEEHSPLERKLPFSVSRDQAPPPSPIAPVAASVDDDSRRILEDYFAQCPHFTLNYGECPPLPVHEVVDATPWRFSDAAVQQLRLYPLCHCAQQQQSARSRERTSSRHSKAEASSSPRLQPSSAQVEPTNGRLAPKGVHAAPSAPYAAPNGRPQNWSGGSPALLPNPGDLNLHLATAQSVNQNVAAMVSRSLNVTEGPGPEEARQVLLHLIWGSNTAPNQQPTSRNSRRRNARTNHPRESAKPTRGRPRQTRRDA